MSRQAKTPRQRAEEALGVAERRVEKCVQRTANALQAYRDASAELDAARVRRDYLAQDPALPGEPVEVEGSDDE